MKREISFETALIIACLIMGASFLFSGCAHVPRETGQLSQEMGSMIANAKTAHHNLLDEYERTRRERIDDYMHHTWIPRLIGKMAEQGELWEKTCKNKNTLDAVMELRDFVLASARQIAAKRKELTDALDETMAELRETIRVHYETLERANATITRNLQSVRTNDEITENLLRKNKIDPEKLTPLRDVSKKLDKMFN